MSLATKVQDLATRIGTEFKTIRTLISGSGTGDTSGLDTTATNLVDAINEVHDAVVSGGSFDATALAAAVHGSTAKTSPVDGDELFLVDSAASNGPKRLTMGNLKNTISALIVNSAPTTLDTLDEIAAALGDDANYAATISTALGGKQPLDADLTAIAGLTSAANKGLQSTGAGTWALFDLTAAGKAILDDADATAQRGTLSVYSQAEIGDPTTDFVATFEAGLV